MRFSGGVKKFSERVETFFRGYRGLRFFQEGLRNFHMGL